MKEFKEGSLKKGILEFIGKKVDITTPEATYKSVLVKDILFKRDTPFVLLFEDENGKEGFIYGGGNSTQVKEVE